jgi:hypothetical protein
MQLKDIYKIPPYRFHFDKNRKPVMEKNLNLQSSLNDFLGTGLGIAKHFSHLTSIIDLVYMPGDYHKLTVLSYRLLKGCNHTGSGQESSLIIEKTRYGETLKWINCRFRSSYIPYPEDFVVPLERSDVPLTRYSAKSAPSTNDLAICLTINGEI